MVELHTGKLSNAFTEKIEALKATGIAVAETLATMADTLIARIKK